MSIFVTAVTKPEGILEWRNQWLALFRDQSKSDLSSSYQWLVSDFIYLSKPSTRKCYIAHRDGILLGALVFEVRKLRLYGNYGVTFLFTGSHYVNDIALNYAFSTADVIDALVHAIAKDYAYAAYMHFENMTNNCHSSLIQWALSSSYSVFSERGRTTSIFDVSNTNYECFIGRLGKKTRTNLRYYKRLIEREIGWIQNQIIRPNSAEQQLELFNKFLKIEQSGWKGEKGSALAQDEENKLYHLALCEIASSEGQMLWQVVTAGEMPIAMNMVIQRDSTLWVVKTAYENEYQKYSPGTVALTDFLQFAIEDQNIATIRMITDVDWVDKWKPRKENYQGMRIFFPSLAGKALVVATRMMKKHWKIVKKT